MSTLQNEIVQSAIMSKKKKNEVKGVVITFFSSDSKEYISLTDIVRYRFAERTNYIIQNWIRTKSAIEFCGLCEQLNNDNFKGIKCDAFKNESYSNSFSLTPQK